MVDKAIFKNKELLIRESQPSIGEECHMKLKETLGSELPSDYLSFLKLGDKIWLDKNCVEYQVMETGRDECTFVFFLQVSSNTDKVSDFIKLHLSPPEFFPEGLIAFAEDGGGDYICFDYREGKDNPNPPVVIWNHEADVGKDVSFVAKDFETFIGVLKSEEEL